ncbi:MAG: 16S rRNA (uracil(1498)-N(3))-methyltransferase [Burkholderiales bacterium]|nr:16S rRNA (uracil(1498)-N(3))-methyltransferase [Burkholderiales bacterium]
MKLPRVYHRAALQVGRDITLEQGPSQHLTRVLRMRPGDALIVFDGAAGEYRAAIRTLERDGVRVRVEAHTLVERESDLRVGLVQVVSAGERMDLTVQKAVELGVAWIQPLLAQRGKVRLDGERAGKRVQHWQRIAIAACEQCGRNRVPAVRPVLDLTAWLGALPGVQAGSARGIVLAPGSVPRLSQLAPPASETALVVGGESGFAAEEIALIEHLGFVAVSLGPRVLRTETAALAALAAMQALWGDF